MLDEQRQIDEQKQQRRVLKKPTRGISALMMGSLTGLLRRRALWLTDASVTTT